jgi:hypothetical protein
MTVARLAISIDAELARAVKRAAGKGTTSAWLADAAERKLRAEGLLRAVHEWETLNGEISAAELSAAEKRQRRAKRP